MSFRLNETNKTREITQKIKASIQAFLNTFSAFDFSGNITNEELKKVVKEIRVVSKMRYMFILTLPKILRTELPYQYFRRS